MLIDKLHEITFVHGWLFGPYIWNDVRKYFTQIKKHNVISLIGYNSLNNLSNIQRIDDLLNSVKEEDIILSYSYSASLILYSNNLARCKGKIVLINPFFKPKEKNIDELKDAIKTNFKKNIRKFIFNCTKKGDKQSKNDYERLLKLFESNPIPTIESLHLGLQDLKKINQSNQMIMPSKNLHIIQSLSDEVNSLDNFNRFERDKFNTHGLFNNSHFPFFEFDKIYEIIKNIK